MKLPVYPENITPRKKPSKQRSNPESLTNRERQVAELLVQGLTHAQIGQLLGINHKTVLKHVIAIKKKFDLKGPAARALRSTGFGGTGKTANGG